MEKIEVFKIWAPAVSKWAQWVKPVVFMGEKRGNIRRETQNIKHLASLKNDTMIIVDMPEESGVFYGLDLAKQGFRPIPLYNSVPGPSGNSLVKVEGITQALIKGAEELQSIPLSDDAPPAFLLDSKRMIGAKNVPGMYDNRSCVFPQDMPSANFLLKNQIKKVIVLQGSNQPIATDLSHIVCRYQEGGLAISRYNTQDNSCEPIKINPPSRFKTLLYRFGVITGLKRHGGGGFGGMVPYPMESGSYSGGSSRRYRVG